jgi:hypothetical protein
VKKHESLVSYIFGLNNTVDSHQVKLKLSMRAILWLKKDYRLSINFMKEVENGHCILKANVFNMALVHRIIRIIPDEIILINGLFFAIFTLNAVE